MLNIISSSRYKFNRDRIKKIVDEVLTSYSIPENAVFNLVFIGKKKMREIAAKYKQENEALPVLSFSYNAKGTEPDNETAYGEVFICYPQAILLAAEREKKTDDMLDQLIQHGLENILN